MKEEYRMLSNLNLEDFVSKIGLSDTNFGVVSRDTFGDLITFFDPDTEYEKVRKAVINNRASRNNMVDSGMKFCQIDDVTYIDGNKTYITILCEVGDVGVGTKISIMVKRVDYCIGGEIKSFLSFESLKNYLERVSK